MHTSLLSGADTTTGFPMSQVSRMLMWRGMSPKQNKHRSSMQVIVKKQYSVIYFPVCHLFWLKMCFLKRNFLIILLIYTFPLPITNNRSGQLLNFFFTSKHIFWYVKPACKGCKKIHKIFFSFIKVPMGVHDMLLTPTVIGQVQAS